MLTKTAPDADLRRRLAEAEAGSLRLRADLANVRRQRDEEIARARRDALARHAASLADVGDDLRRALQSAPETDGPWHDGLQRLLDSVSHRLRTAGVMPFGTAGEAFDPVRHEAVGMAAGPPGTVVDVVRTGIALGDGTLLRPASVLVAPPPAEDRP